MGELYVETFKVRWAECDPQKVVFNGSYFIYFDTVQANLWTTACGSWQERHERGVDTVLVETHVRYRQPALVDDVLQVSAAVEHLGTTSARLSFEAVRDGTVLVEATSWYVIVDSTTLTKKPIPQWMRDGLSAFML